MSGDDIMDNLRLPRLEKGFCCCSLQTGVKVVGYIHLVPMVLLCTAAFVENVMNDYHRFVRNTHEPIDDFEAVFFRDQYLLAKILMIFSASTLLLLGVYKRSYTLMDPFICIKGISVLMTLIDLLIAIMGRFKGRKTISTFIFLILMAVHSYIFTLVYSYRKRLANRTDSETDV